ncbi:uncharacterized protein SCHCODRAFT_02490991 [Schizophyllum commune H4-8]|uniref:uncharacterized protein n=1 Tax=Schizophyllum commune (strain H4-8 / FGSC 9210) TaxID=578458 RepID=UPI002160F2B6|nr:uncharacterized protein SCHCODRAFT_02490991 [Schizophyllum commune H4-8]KAI5896610.1 hypothetical protein SCHCODRAFT_02490991 [Schizophyllum commune H4-8]
MLDRPFIFASELTSASFGPLLFPRHLSSLLGLPDGETGPKGPSLGIGRAQKRGRRQASTRPKGEPHLLCGRGPTGVPDAGESSSGEKQGAEIPQDWVARHQCP